MAEDNQTSKRRRIILILTEQNLVCYRYDPSAEEPFFINDTERKFFVQAVFVLFACGRWTYKAYEKNKIPYLPGIGMGIESYRPVFVLSSQKGAARPLSETIKEHEGFVVPLSEALALIERKPIPAWHEEKGLAVKDDSEIAIPLRDLDVLRKVPEIKSAVARAAANQAEA